MKNDTVMSLQPQHNYITPNSKNKRIPTNNLTLFKHSLSFSGPKTWNSIPDNIKNLPSVNFKKKTEKFYFP